MKRLIKYFLTTVIIFTVFSCQPYDRFEQELYKKVICLLSDDDYVFSIEHDLNDDISSGYISVSHGGTNKLNSDITVELEIDSSLLDEYNRLQFDTITTSYARFLPDDKFEIPTFFVDLTNENTYSKLEIKIQPEGLSPDSLYMIPLKIKEVSNSEVNPQKSRVLYNVMLKNEYARQKVTSYYKMKGTRAEEESIDKVHFVTADKVLFPIAKNKVRTLVGTHAFAGKQATLEDIDEYGIELIVNPDSTVTILPSGSAEIEMLGNTEDNYFETRNGIQTFVLNYQYYGYSTTHRRWMWIIMKETLSRQS